MEEEGKEKGTRCEWLYQPTKRRRRRRRSVLVVMTRRKERKKERKKNKNKNKKNLSKFSSELDFGRVYLWWSTHWLRFGHINKVI